jgi:hypothetical protein
MTEEMHRIAETERCRSLSQCFLPIPTPDDHEMEGGEVLL